MTSREIKEQPVKKDLDDLNCMLDINKNLMNVVKLVELETDPFLIMCSPEQPLMGRGSNKNL